jgi:hypothetical protein
VRSGRLADHARIVFGRCGRPVREHRNSVQLAVGNAEIGPVDPERCADLFLEKLPDRTAVHAVENLTVDVPVIQRVIRRALADREHRREIRDAAAHPIPVGQPFRRIAHRRLRHTGLMSHGMAERRILFAVRTELGPHLDDRHVVREAVLLDAEV